MKKVRLLFTFSLTLIVFYSCNTLEKSEDKKEVKKIENTEDYKNVKLAILDYVEGIYLVDSTRIEKSVDTTMRKIGYWYHPKKKTYVDNLEMTHKQLVSLAARWNKDGKSANDKSVKEIEIFDVNSKTASAKLTAAWGIDLFHLAKVNEQWKIINVIWQSQPKTE